MPISSRRRAATSYDNMLPCTRASDILDAYERARCETETSMGNYREQEWWGKREDKDIYGKLFLPEGLEDGRPRATARV